MKNKTKEEPLFLAAPFFMARMPVLPAEYFSSFLQGDNLHSDVLSKFTQDPLIRESIMVASSRLYEALRKKNVHSKASASLCNYLNRMCSRTTPFGLFSCVSLCEWGESLSNFLDFEKIYKRARPDMKWLSLVIEQLCKDPLLIPFLSVRKNPLLLELGGRAFLKDVPSREGEKKKNTSIRLSFITEAIFELTKNAIKIEDLKDTLLLRFPELNREKLHQMIETLLKEQFLDFDLKPSLLNNNPFSEVLSKASSSQLSSKLYTISNQIERYNQAPFGHGEEHLHHIHHIMDEVAPCDNFLQVDTAYSGKKITLPKTVIAELQRSVELLWKIGDITSTSFLASYHTKFLDKYGTCRTVPILELLTDEGGLGVPEHYAHSTPKNPIQEDAKRKKWNEWLKKQWTLCLKKNLQEVEIDEQIVNEINEKPSKEKALPSFDLRCDVIANNPEEIDQGRFLLQIEPFAWQAGATFGRFIHLLGNETRDKLQALYKEEEDLEEESLFIESSYHHMNLSRSANVMIHPNLRNHSIDLGGKGTISLDEIYIGATPERLYVTLKDGKKELRVTSNNMLNPTSAPIPLRFIRDVSNSKYRLLEPFSWQDIRDSVFLPRIRYKNTIFSPAQWKVDLFQLSCTLKDDITVIEEAFCQWANIWELPRYLLISEDDNRLLLDRYHQLHLREIALEIKKGKIVHLIEKTQTGHIQSEKGTHHVEFIIPFIKNKKYSPHLKKPYTTTHQSIPTHSRWKLPGSDCLFIKYYLGVENENRFLIEECHNWVQPFLKKGVFDGWSFVRYSDPEPHVRIRFYGEQEQIVTQLIPEIQKWAMRLKKNRIIGDMTLSAYEREVERYGGEELIGPTEALFCADTETTIFLVRGILGKNFSLTEEVVAAISMIDLLKGFGLTLNEQIDFFSYLYRSKEELAGFRQWKNSIVSLCRTFFENTGVGIDNDTSFLFEAFQRRSSSLNAYAETMQKIKEKKKLATSAHSIYDSILHMHYNRLIGRSGKEKKVRLYAYHTLKLLQKQQERLVTQSTV